MVVLAVPASVSVVLMVGPLGRCRRSPSRAAVSIAPGESPVDTLVRTPGTQEQEHALRVVVDRFALRSPAPVCTLVNALGRQRSREAKPATTAWCGASGATS